MKKTRKKRQSPSLSEIQKVCPWVQSIADADEKIQVKVTQADVDDADVKSHLTCALAIACRRRFHADIAFIQVTVAYIVKGLRATRYRLGQSIQKEIVVFDRKGPFKAGIYQLNPPSPSNRLGLVRSYDPVRKAKNSGNHRPRFMHYTEGTRPPLSRLPADRFMEAEIKKLKLRLKGNHKK